MLIFYLFFRSQQTLSVRRGHVGVTSKSCVLYLKMVWTNDMYIFLLLKNVLKVLKTKFPEIWHIPQFY